MSDATTIADETTEPTTDEPKPGTRAPFTEAHLTRMKFGARSPRVYGAVAERLLEDLLIAKPELADYPEEVAAVAQQEAIVALMRMEMAAGVRDKLTGQPRLALIARYFSAERSAAKARDRIGLAPKSEAEIARERAEATRSVVDLHALAARGQAALEARAATPDLVTITLAEVRDEYAAEKEAAARAWAARTGGDPDTTEVTRAADAVERHLTHDHQDEEG